MPRSIYTVPAQKPGISFHTTKDGHRLPLLGTVTRPSGVLTGPVPLVDHIRAQSAAPNAAANLRRWDYAEYPPTVIGENTDTVTTGNSPLYFSDSVIHYDKRIDANPQNDEERSALSLTNQEAARQAVFGKLNEWPNAYSEQNFIFGDTTAQTLLMNRPVNEAEIACEHIDYEEYGYYNRARVNLRQHAAFLRWLIFPGAATGAQVVAKVSFEDIVITAQSLFETQPIDPVRLQPQLVLYTPPTNWTGQWPAAGVPLQHFLTYFLGTLDIPVKPEGMAGCTHILDAADAPTYTAAFTVPASRVVLPVLRWHSGFVTDFIHRMVPIARDPGEVSGASFFSLISNGVKLTISDTDIGK